MYMFLLGKYPGVELLKQRIHIPLVGVDIPK